MKSIRFLVKVLLCAIVFTSSSVNSKAACIACEWYFGWTCVYLASVNCGEYPTSDDWGSYCEPYSAISVLYVDNGNNAMVEAANGKRIMVASDMRLDFLKKTKNNKSLTFQELTKLNADFIKKDNGFVSQSTINEIAKTNKLNVLKVKILPKANYCPPCDKNIIPKEESHPTKSRVKTQG